MFEEEEENKGLVGNVYDLICGSCFVKMVKNKDLLAEKKLIITTEQQ